jgi:hypothetical protein
MKFYGIRNKNTKTPVEFEVESNDGAEFCGSVTFRIYYFNPPANVWLIRDKVIAETVLNGPITPWYNADYESPVRSERITSDDFEVFEVEI